MNISNYSIYFLNSGNLTKQDATNILIKSKNFVFEECNLMKFMIVLNKENIELLFDKLSTLNKEYFITNNYENTKFFNIEDDEYYYLNLEKIFKYIRYSLIYKEENNLSDDELVFLNGSEDLFSSLIDFSINEDDLLNFNSRDLVYYSECKNDIDDIYNYQIILDDEPYIDNIIYFYFNDEYNLFNSNNEKMFTIYKTLKIDKNIFNYSDDFVRIIFSYVPSIKEISNRIEQKIRDVLILKIKQELSLLNFNAQLSEQYLIFEKIINEKIKDCIKKNNFILYDKIRQGIDIG